MQSANTIDIICMPPEERYSAERLQITDLDPKAQLIAQKTAADRDINRYGWITGITTLLAMPCTVTYGLFIHDNGLPGFTNKPDIDSFLLHLGTVTGLLVASSAFLIWKTGKDLKYVKNCEHRIANPNWTG
ncbi:hypothetical protein J4219_07540 [Candidatus Woesearchaeota archaeon]|nr:hypothetical protein [Candidatus Woesearchaeota archaeon]